MQTSALFTRQNPYTFGL